MRREKEKKYQILWTVLIYFRENVRMNGAFGGDLFRPRISRNFRGSEETAADMAVTAAA